MTTSEVASKKPQASILDISVLVHPDMPVWPGSAGFTLIRTRQIATGDHVNVSVLTQDMHVGTHVDAPLHFVDGAASVDLMALETLIGPAQVVYLPEVDSITAGTLEGLALAPGTKRLLFRTRNSRLWAEGDNTFREDFVALTADAAQWVVDHGIALVGVDYLSVQRYHDGPETHQILLRAGVVIIEGLNLDGIAPGTYELLCLPIKLLGAEGAPARAILRTLPREG